MCVIFKSFNLLNENYGQLLNFGSFTQTNLNVLIKIMLLKINKVFIFKSIAALYFFKGTIKIN